MTTTKQTYARRMAAAGVALVLALTACGTDDNTGGTNAGGNPSIACATGTITGAGSTFVQTIVQQWIKDFSAQCAGATVNYQGVGSGAGIQQFTEGTVDFGATDVVMKPDEETAAKAKAGDVLHIPWSAGGIAVMYNLDGVRDLRLSPQTLAGIYSGTIKRWNDAALTADNPGVQLPDAPIAVVHRSDGSGTTSVFTSYLTKNAPDVWKAGAGKDVPWPTGEGAKGSDGVTAAVKSTPGAIGYAELSYPAANNIPVALVKNAAGEFRGPTPEAVAAALASTEVPADMKFEANYAPTDPAAYPLSTPTWVIVPLRPSDSTKAALLRAFVSYAVTDGQASASRLYYAPLPDALKVKVSAAAATIGVG